MRSPAAIHDRCCRRSPPLSPLRFHSKQKSAPQSMRQSTPSRAPTSDVLDSHTSFFAILTVRSPSLPVTLGTDGDCDAPTTNQLHCHIGGTEGRSRSSPGRHLALYRSSHVPEDPR